MLVLEIADGRNRSEYRRIRLRIHLHHPVLRIWPACALEMLLADLRV